VIDQHMSKAVADIAIVGDALDALPQLEALEVANCLDDESVTALAGRIVDLPLRSLELDRLSNAAAQILIDAGRSFELVTQRESVAAATRDKLHRVVRWRSTAIYGGRNRRPRRVRCMPRHEHARDLGALRLPS
jgi:hypothetical protein